MMNSVAVLPYTHIRKEAAMEGFLKVSQVAKRLGVSVKTINEWIKNGDFPGTTKLNPGVKRSPYRIPEKAVEAFEEKRKSFSASADTEKD